MIRPGKNCKLLSIKLIPRMTFPKFFYFNFTVLSWRVYDTFQDIVIIRGGTYRETVTPSNSGNSSSPITYKPYESEEVVVSGADVISGWTQYDGNIYSASMPSSLGVGYDQVFVNRQMVTWARWPNTSAENISTPAWDTSSTVSAQYSSGGYDVSLTDADIPGDASNWIDAYVHMATGSGWIHQTGQIESGSSKTISFRMNYLSESGYYAPTSNNRYFITGAYIALDSAGEWFRDNNGTLFLWQPGGGNPSGSLVEYKARSNAFDLSDKSYITIEGINIFAAQIVTNAGSSNITINGVVCEYPSHYDILGTSSWSTGTTNTGIVLRGTDNLLINSEIALSAGNGVSLNGSGHKILNCVIHDVNYMGTDAAGVFSSTIGGVVTEKAEIAWNTIYNSGRGLILHRYIESSSIHHNELHHSMLQTSDGGATYTYGLGNDGKGTVFAYNKIHDNYAFGDSSSANTELAAGIYLDNGSCNYIVTRNIVWNCRVALKLNTYDYAQNHKVINNTLIGTGAAVGAWGNEGYQNVEGTEFINNIFVGSVSGYFSDWNTTGNNYNTTSGVGSVQFINAATGNFRLNSYSQAANIGTVASVYPYTLGYHGNNPDAGAIEYGDDMFAAGADATGLSESRMTHIAPLGSTTIIAGFYDIFGEGVSYHDSSTENYSTNETLAARYTEAVDVTGNGYLGWITDGEWVEYTIYISFPGEYDFTINVPSEFLAGDYIDITSYPSRYEEGQYLGTITGGETTSLNQVYLEAGVHILRFNLRGAGFGFQSISIENSQQPYTGSAYTVGYGSNVTIPAGYYDLGGEGVAYHDSSSGNDSTTGIRQDEDVDVTSNAYLGWIADGEWVEYSINVSIAQEYNFSFYNMSLFNAEDAITIRIFDAESGSFGRVGGTLYGGRTENILSGVSLNAGPQVIRLEFTGSGFGFESFTIHNTQQPYTGSAFAVEYGSSVTIPAGYFDLGGEGVAYHDSSSGNYSTTGIRQDEDVDVTSNAYLGWIDDGEWVEYSIDVNIAQEYDISFYNMSLFNSEDAITIRIFDSESGSSGRIGGTLYGGRIGNILSGVKLNAGKQVIRLELSGSGFGFQSFTIQNTQQPYTGTAFAINNGSSITIPAGYFDTGGQGVAYYDLSSGNYATDGIREDEDVDVGDDAYVGWITNGEWLEYTINVDTAQERDISFYNMSLFNLEDAITVRIFDSESGNSGHVVGILYGGGSENILSNVSLNAEIQVIRLELTGGGFGFESFTFE